MGFADILKKGAQVLGTDTYSSGIKAGQSLLGGFVNEFFADRARKKNFETNEQAAKNADARQRAQYQELYSPQAMMQQYAAAGLSPSMMMSGGASAVGGTPQGNAGGGASGGYPSAGSPMDLTAGLHNELLKAQIQNLNADSEGKNIENDIRRIDKELKEMAQSTYSKEFMLMNMTLEKGGNPVTFKEFANTAENYDDFWKSVKEATKYADSGMQHFMASEQGQQIMRAIYMANKSLDNDIAVLSSSKMSAEFQLKITKWLKDSEYAEQNAKTAVEQLKAMGSDAELTNEQKTAWNNLIDKLGDGTWKDIIIVIAMIAQNFVGGSGLTFNTGTHNTTITNNNTHNNSSHKVWNKFIAED